MLATRGPGWRCGFDFSTESMQDRYVFWCGMGAKRHVESDVRPQDEDGTAHEDRSRWTGVAAARRVAKARETCVLDQFIEKMRETPESIT